ncbi:hypothetical protein HDE_00877 [Halotydeus destructor]|nr:hypothetical protein HDE_00877 [Halotydeus destructor]
MFWILSFSLRGTNQPADVCETLTSSVPESCYAPPKSFEAEISRTGFCVSETEPKRNKADRCACFHDVDDNNKDVRTPSPIPADRDVNNLTLKQELDDAQIDLGSNSSESSEISEGELESTSKVADTVQKSEFSSFKTALSAGNYDSQMRDLKVELEMLKEQNVKYRVEAERKQAYLEWQTEILKETNDRQLAIESLLENSIGEARELKELLAKEQKVNEKLRQELKYSGSEILNLTDRLDTDKSALRVRYTSHIASLEKTCEMHQEKVLETTRRIDDQVEEIGQLHDKIQRLTQQLSEAKTKLASVHELKSAAREFQQQILLGANADHNILEVACETIRALANGVTQL